MLPGPLATATYLNRLWTIPFTSNTQLLWYNKKLVKTPPTTWAQMIQQAVQLKSKVEIQGKKYEGLTVWFNSLIQSAGGPDPHRPGPARARRAGQDGGHRDEEPGHLRRPPTRRCPTRRRTTTGSPSRRAASPSRSTTRSSTPRPRWCPELQPNIGFARWPRVVANLPSRPPIGGINLGVSAYSKNPSRAFQAALCLAEPQNQIIASQKGGLPPTQASLYDTKPNPDSLPVRGAAEDEHRRRRTAAGHAGL